LKFGFLAIGLFATASVLQAADTDLPPSVQNALNARNLPHDSLSVFVSEVDTGEVVLKWLDDQPRNPASTIKLLTTLVALDVLGPAYRWRTDVFVDGELKDGRLDGNLMLKGYGDPFLVTERVWQLLRSIRHKGIREISGGLSLDDGWFEIGDYDPAAFDRQPLRAYNVAPNALMMNFKVIRYLFEPDLAGGSVDVTMDPVLGNVSVENRLGLANSSCHGYQRGITVTTNETDDEVTFSGRFPNGCKRYAMDRTALSHNEFVYGLFASLWRESGGSIDGGWKNVVIEEDREPLLSFDSRPLTEMIALINKHSNNVMARQLMYTLGAEVNGPPGTEDSGKAVIEQWLANEGLASTQIAIENGAGLSRNTRTTARDMSAMLEFAWRQPYMPEYLASMSLSGLDGTLRRRFGDTNLVGKAHLKTGSLDHVTAIAGFLQSRSGRRFTVVAMQNFEDIHRGPGEEVQEAILRWLYDQ
jgi:D-alanyl-D-alanine carboxypeptidase/D-alanyl-D-alanine-endopeptidase (penicillin-binding protein 4)